MRYLNKITMKQVNSRRFNIDDIGSWFFGLNGKVEKYFVMNGLEVL